MEVEDILYELQDLNPDAVLMSPEFNEALLGVVYKHGMTAVALYDYDECLNILQRSMELEDALDIMEFNVLLGSMIDEENNGANSPVFQVV